ncbi:type I CRISPR-associated protein Cas7 [Streptomyces hokutonensis]|uniref:type I CRISPR-associated protein Cas7 n=1 Tax=Streptomyces hokutonensis TaxID=1306990 RepID=UPI00380A90C7
MTEHKAPEAEPFMQSTTTATTTLLVNVPLRNTSFVGRQALLRAVEEQLGAQHTAAVLPHALHGLGGVGKSELALEYIYTHQHDYRVIWWIAAERESLILAAYWQAMTMMFDHDRAASRGEMALRGLYVFSHDDAYGRVPAHKLFDRIRVKSLGDSEARSWDEYADRITIDQDEGQDEMHRYDIDLGELLPPPSPWRTFAGGPAVALPPTDDEEIERRLGRISALFAGIEQVRREADMVNAALLLRRPLLVTGRSGAGKSSLAYRISRELKLGRVLRWHITSRTTLWVGLYEYDAIGRVQDSTALRALAPTGGPGAAANGRPPGEEQFPGIGDYLQLGPLGTALLPYDLPRVLLVDELDKSDHDLPNDLLSVFEEGQFSIAELVQARRLHTRVTVMTGDPGHSAEIVDGVVECRIFPLVVITSNGEREFLPAFLRRWLGLRMPEPDGPQLVDMVMAHLRETANGTTGTVRADDLIDRFLHNSRERGGLAVDQLLNAIYLATSRRFLDDDEEALENLVDALWHRLGEAGGPMIGV